jgi:hypothetical protein
VHHEFDEVTETAGLLVETVGLQQKLLFQGGTLQVAGQGIDDNLIADFSPKKLLPCGHVITGQEIGLQGGEQSLADRGIQRVSVPRTVREIVASR